jgi:transcriptional regulator with XRE-family HTH domain
MAGKSNVQTAIERAREKYGEDPPLLQRVCLVHGISVRDFAAIFKISKTHAAEIIAHRKLPDLELAVRISRYWEVEVEELFGWRIDDDGARRPLLVIDPSTGQVRKLVGQNRTGAIDVALGGRH